MRDPSPYNDPLTLMADGPLKVWSVVITAMGDLIREPQQSLSGRVLGHLTERMGITNQALRVALHRLKRDGWVRAERTGRTSDYFLSTQGWKATQKVRPVIYSLDLSPRAQVCVVACPPALTAAEFAESLSDEAVFLSPRMALTVRSDPGLTADFFVSDLDTAQLPDWARAAIADENLRAGYSTLADQVSLALARPLPAALPDRTVLRLMILHHWRRLSLRHGSLPDLLLPADWEGARARTRVTNALELIERPEIAALSAAIDDSTPV